MQKLISVIVPCFNQAEFLSDALQSVFEQSYQNWECIIINDGSTDNTEAVAKDWYDRDKRFIYFVKENGGLSSARNYGLSKSKGEFIQFLDADDFLESEKFSASLKIISENPGGNEKIVVTNYRIYLDEKKQYQPPYCDLNKQIISYESILFQWDEYFSIPIHCALFDSRMFYFFRFPEDLRAKEDWVMWTLLLQKSPHLIYLGEPLVIYRKHSKSMTMSEGIFEQHMAALAYLKKHIGEGEYVKLLELMMQRYYKASLRFKNELYELQRSKFYRAQRVLQRLVKKVKSGMLTKKIK